MIRNPEPGFPCPQEEIRKLAEGSGRASKDIAALIKIVRIEIEQAPKATGAVLIEVDQGSTLAREASSSIEEISLVVRKSVSLAEEIAIASENQSHSTTNVADTMGSVSSLTLEASASTAQMARNIGGLAEMAERLKETISRFKLADEYARTGATQTSRGTRGGEARSAAAPAK